MKPLQVLLVSSEMAPFAKVGGLADVVGTLPYHLRAHGCDARVVLPLYKRIKERYAEQLEFVRWSMLRMGWRTLYSGLFRLDYEGLVVYFIDNEFYFGHDAIYLDYSFDIERFSFFQRAVLEAMGAAMDFTPDVIHCNDWQAGMIPCLLHVHYQRQGHHKKTRTVYTIHNLKYQGIHGIETIADLMDMPAAYLTEEHVLCDGVPNFMKAGIVFADAATTVSPSYAAEIMTPQYGEGLDRILRQYAYKITGILNGIDTDAFDPRHDPLISRLYGDDDWRAGKQINKYHLQVELGLEVDPNAPLAVMVSRLVDQKGVVMLMRILDRLLDAGFQLAIQGTGDPHYEWQLSEAANRHAGRLAAVIAYDHALAHRVYAAGDLFLMPSLFEPCGLAQMIAMRYGTVPVVRETGGLKDTVQPYNRFTGEGNGFSFAGTDAEEFLAVLGTAAAVFRNQPEVWSRLVAAGMGMDFSWEASAAAYAALFADVSERECAIR